MGAVNPEERQKEKMIIKSYDDLYEHIKGISMVNKDKITILCFISARPNVLQEI